MCRFGQVLRAIIIIIVEEAAKLGKSNWFIIIDCVRDFFDLMQAKFSFKSTAFLSFYLCVEYSG